MSEQLLLRRRDAARVLGFSQAQILKFERKGLLRPIAVEGLRSVRYDSAEVEALAKRWIAASKPQEACAC
jgi:predicted DNA-binding transcriptional regulator AlpA